MILLELRGIDVRFGAVHALSGVDFSVDRGEVVALVGDNGAGKSTLVKVIAGIRPPDRGELRVDGVVVRSASPADAVSHGITTVHQDLSLCDNLDVVANLFLGQERTSAKVLNEEAMEVKAQELIGSLRVRTLTHLHAEVARLSGGQRQSIAIARALVGAPKLVVLDEPTAALGVVQTSEVLALVRRLRDKGLGVVLISHNMADVFEVSDRIHVLLRGETNGVFQTSESSADEIIGAVTGATRLTQSIGESL